MRQLDHIRMADGVTHVVSSATGRLFTIACDSRKYDFTFNHWTLVREAATCMECVSLMSRVPWGPLRLERRKRHG